MARYRLTRRFKDSAQLVLGFALPAFLIIAFVFALQRRASSSRRDASNALYSSISNAIVSRISVTNQFRLVPMVELQYRRSGDNASYSGWYEVGPDSRRTWFHVKVSDQGPPLKLSDVEFFPEKPDLRY